MIWLEWSAFGLLEIILLVVVVRLIGTLVSLDWKRRHSAATAGLDPLRVPHEQANGLAAADRCCSSARLPRDRV